MPLILLLVLMAFASVAQASTLCAELVSGAFSRGGVPLAEASLRNYLSLRDAPDEVSSTPGLGSLQQQRRTALAAARASRPGCRWFTAPATPHEAPFDLPSSACLPTEPTDVGVAVHRSGAGLAADFAISGGDAIARLLALPDFLLSHGEEEARRRGLEQMLQRILVPIRAHAIADYARNQKIPEHLGTGDPQRDSWTAVSGSPTSIAELLALSERLLGVNADDELQAVLGRRGSGDTFSGRSGFFPHKIVLDLRTSDRVFARLTAYVDVRYEIGADGMVRIDSAVFSPNRNLAVQVHTAGTTHDPVPGPARSEAMIRAVSKYIVNQP